MPTPEWTAVETNSGLLAKTWRSQPAGSSLRLALLERHIEEVADEIQTGSSTAERKSHDKTILLEYLRMLEKTRDDEERRNGLLTGKRVAFTRGRAIIPKNGLGPYKGLPPPPF